MDDVESAGGRGPTGRTLTLLALLQTHRHWTGAELADRLGVTERTVRRDVERLRDLGYPIDASPGAAGGYQLGRGSQLPPLLLDDDEAVALAVGLHTAVGSGIEGIDDIVLGAMTKLEQVLPDHLRRRVDALRSVEVLRWAPGDSATVSTDALAVLSRGCRDREQVQFEYQRRDGEELRRLVEPHHLVSAGRRWYLVAWDVRRDDWRMFRLDRMTSPRLAGGRFEPRELPADDAASFVAAGLSAGADRSYRAGLVIDRPAEELADIARWQRGDLEPIDASSARLTIAVAQAGWLAASLASLAVAVDYRIEYLSDEVRAELDVVMARMTNAIG